MHPSDTSKLERRLVLLLLLIFCVPLPLTVLVHFTKGRAGLAGAFSRVVIGGVIDSPSPPAPAPPPLSFAGVRDASYQQAVATSFDTGYPGRDWILRAANEVYLRVFRTGLGGVVIGRGFSAFYNKPPYEFVDEYCVERAAPDALAPLVDDLRRLRDNCRRRGAAFVVVVTPSKTAIYPEELPWSWKRRIDPRPRNYDHFVRLLQQEKIPYVDGHLLTLEAKQEAPVRVFPLGGIHWSHYASMKTVNAVLSALAAQGQPVRPVEDPRAVIFHHHAGQDADMVGTIHPLFDWSYPVDRMSFHPPPTKEGTRPSLVVSGTSFVETLGWYLNATGNFSETHWLRFYKLFKSLPEGEGWRTVQEPLPVAEREQEIFSTRCLVLEFNEQLITYAHDLADLYGEPASHLPGPAAPQPVFPYENLLRYQWGQPLSFMGASLPGRPDTFSGLSGPSPIGAWTMGNDATLRLAVPSLEQDAVVTVDAGAVLAPGKLPVQHVTVFANEQAVAEWTYDAPGLQRREAVVPRAMLGDGRLILRLHFAQTISPAQITGSGDTRPFALLVQQVSLRQRYGPVDFPLLDASKPSTDPIYAVHFAPGQPDGRWTIGPTATIRLAAPDSDGDVVLTAKVGAALDPGALPVQRARITVNGQAVGEWVFEHGGVELREVTIPRELRMGATMEIGFQFSGTVCPAEVGKGKDRRHLALLFKNIQLHGRGPTAGPPPPSAVANGPH